MQKILPDKIVLATSNSGKIREFTETGPLPFQLIPQTAFNIQSPQETGLTFIENALIKARYAAKESGLPTIADDSGLLIDALNGAPGLYSSRYAGENASREQKIAKILDVLSNVPSAQRSAQFYCVLIFIQHWDDPLPLISEGWWQGKILMAPQGINGFGFEPIFYVPTHQCSAAEISLVEKMQLSHRGKSWRQLLNMLQQSR